MNKTRIMIVALVLIIMQSCSNRQMYNSIQYKQRLECQKVHPSVYEECMERNSERYDKYKKKRDEVVEDN